MPIRRKSGYIKKLSAYNFDIYHFPGVKNLAGTPSRRPDYITKPMDNEVQWNLNLLDESVPISAVV